MKEKSFGCCISREKAFFLDFITGDKPVFLLKTLKPTNQPSTRKPAYIPTLRSLH
jgi:hypothetical protein